MWSGQGSDVPSDTNVCTQTKELKLPGVEFEAASPVGRVAARKLAGWVPLCQLKAELPPMGPTEATMAPGLECSLGNNSALWSWRVVISADPPHIPLLSVFYAISLCLPKIR